MASETTKMYQKSSRYFRHKTKFSSCDVVEIHAGYIRLSAHFYADHSASIGPNPSMHSKNSIDSYLASGLWIEMTLEELLTKQGVLAPTNKLFADMHQIEQGDPPNPLFPTSAQIDDQKWRATRFHSAWTYFHDRWQRQLRGNPMCWRYCELDDPMAARHRNKVKGLARRLCLGQVGLFSDDPKVAFAAQFTALSRILDGKDENVGYAWAYSMLRNRMTQTGRLFYLDEAFRVAGNKFACSDWSVPFFDGLALKDEYRWHFVHTSKADPTKVAYAKDWRALWSLVDPTVEDKTDATNKFVVTTPGKYLKKFYGDVLTEVQIRDMAAACVAEALPPMLHVATTEADIIKAIAEGPTESCMANGYHHDDNRKEYGWFNSPVHPAAIYASGEIEVLYIKNSDGEITARAIANASTKKVARIYGDGVKMQKAMSANGYEQQIRALVGCRVRKILFNDDRKIVMAYVDAGIGSGGGSLYARDEGEAGFLRLTTDDHGDNIYNTYDGYNNRGYSPVSEYRSGYVCDCCNDEMSDDDAHTVFDRNGYEVMVCEICQEEYYRFAYGRHGNKEWHHRDRCVLVNDNYYVRQYASDNGIGQATCGPSDGEWFDEDNLVYVDEGRAFVEDCVRLDVEYNGYDWALDDDATVTEDGDTIHVDVARACALTGETWHKKDMIQIRPRLPGENPRTLNSAWIHVDSIVNKYEELTVWFPIPLRAAVLVIGHPEIGFGLAEFDFSKEEFKNIRYIGDDVDLPMALSEVYDEHHEKAEELEAA